MTSSLSESEKDRIKEKIEDLEGIIEDHNAISEKIGKLIDNIDAINLGYQGDIHFEHMSCVGEIDSLQEEQKELEIRKSKFLVTIKHLKVFYEEHEEKIIYIQEQREKDPNYKEKLRDFQNEFKNELDSALKGINDEKVIDFRLAETFEILEGIEKMQESVNELEELIKETNEKQEEISERLEELHKKEYELNIDDFDATIFKEFLFTKVENLREIKKLIEAEISSLVVELSECEDIVSE